MLEKLTLAFIALALIPPASFIFGWFVGPLLEWNWLRRQRRRPS
jgi:hypothetical protein